MAVQSIKYLVVIPKTIKSAVFYINNNLKDAHYKEINDLYEFIAGMMKPPATVQLQKLIFHHLAFYVDIGKNTVEELTHNEAAQITELKTKIRKNVIKNLLKALRAKAEEQDQNLPDHQGYVDHTIDRSLSLINIEGTKGRSSDTDTEIQKRQGDFGAKIFDKL